jgi:hypothetical protein
MKIKKCEYYIIELNGVDYRRNSEDCWERRYGESWESEYGKEKELELKFQKKLKDLLDKEIDEIIKENGMVYRCGVNNGRKETIEEVLKYLNIRLAYIQLIRRKKAGLSLVEYELSKTIKEVEKLKELK